MIEVGISRTEHIHTPNDKIYFPALGSRDGINANLNSVGDNLDCYWTAAGPYSTYYGRSLNFHPGYVFPRGSPPHGRLLCRPAKYLIYLLDLIIGRWLVATARHNTGEAGQFEFLRAHSYIVFIDE